MTGPKPGSANRPAGAIRDEDIVTRASLTRRRVLGAGVAAMVAPPAAAQRRPVSDTDTGAGGDPAQWGRGATGTLTDTDPARDPPGAGQVGKRVHVQRECVRNEDEDKGPRADPVAQRQLGCRRPQQNDADDGAQADPPGALYRRNLDRPLR